MKITRDMIISEVLNMDRGTVPIFSEAACIASAAQWRPPKPLKRPARFMALTVIS